MATQLWAVGLVILSTIVGSFGPIFLKKGSDKVDRNSLNGLKSLLKSTAGNLNLILGIGMYGLGFLIYLPALNGGELSVIYPLISLSYVFVAVLSVIMLKEKMNLLKWAGIAIIVFGAALIGIGS